MAQKCQRISLNQYESLIMYKKYVEELCKQGFPAAGKYTFRLWKMNRSILKMY